MFFAKHKEEVQEDAPIEYIDPIKVAEAVEETEKLSQPKQLETEHLRRDLIAGSAMSKCKHYARELLRARAFETNMRKFSVAELNFLNCTNEYAAVRCCCFLAEK